MIGRTLSHYEIVDELGRGGMGEVYRARDTKLKREVAIKVLPEEFARDKNRLARFEREAQLLASLNHPNIASIHGIEEEDGVKALVLELVEGPTLAERLADGPIPVDEAVAIAKQIADALEAAHGAGVIHRDLKPANVKLTEDGQVKVLDFGLAKALQGDVAERTESELSQSPTLTREGTAHGVILGTAAYMSPEQAKGKRVDRQTDIWAFGAVLYEMLTGKRAFSGEDVSDVLAAVLRSEPDWSALPATTPPSIRQVLRLCLTKDRKERLQAVGDVRLALDGAFVMPSPVGHRSLARAPIAAAFVLGGLVVAAFLLSGSRGPESEATSPVRFAVPLPRSSGFAQIEMAVSPTNEHLALRFGEDLYLRSLAAFGATQLTDEGYASSPAFSPDGEWLAYVAKGQLKKIPVQGDAAPIFICNVSGAVSGASWADDDTIVFAQDPGGIYRVASTGGEPEAIVALEDEVAAFPQVLPGNDMVLFVSRSSRGTPWEEARIVAQALETGERKVLTAGRAAIYVPTGHLVYHREDNLLAAPFDPSRLELTGASVPVVSKVLGNSWPFANWTAFDVSSSGGLVYLPLAPSENTVLVRVSSDGEEHPMSLPSKPYDWVHVSPSGGRIVLGLEPPGTDIWMHDFTTNVTRRFTFDPAADRSPIWTPDGERIIFWSERDGGGFFWKRSDGTGTVERLTPPTFTSAWAYSVTPDGSRLLFNTGESGEDFNIYTVTLDDEHVVEPLLNAPYDERRASVSPDGRWIAYMSDESGKHNIMVRSFPDVERGGQWQISSDGGVSPRWSHDGTELFYWKEQALMRVAVEGGPTFRFSAPEVTLEGPYRRGAGAYDDAPDGESFLLIRGESVGGQEVHVVLNWFEELEARVPANR